MSNKIVTCIDKFRKVEHIILHKLPVFVLENSSNSENYFHGNLMQKHIFTSTLPDVRTIFGNVAAVPSKMCQANEF